MVIVVWYSVFVYVFMLLFCIYCPFISTWRCSLSTSYKAGLVVINPQFLFEKVSVSSSVWRTGFLGRVLLDVFICFNTSYPLLCAARFLLKTPLLVLWRETRRCFSLVAFKTVSDFDFWQFDDTVSHCRYLFSQSDLLWSCEAPRHQVLQGKLWEPLLW